MPPCRVVFFRDVHGCVPVLNWLRHIGKRDRAVVAKCYERITRLAELGHELRRPLADYLRDGIYELRVRRGTVNYRILYAFHDQTAAVLVHALTKDAAVPRVDIDGARERKQLFERDPGLHCYIHGSESQ